MAEQEGHTPSGNRRLGRRAALAGLTAIFLVAAAGYSAYWLTTGRFHESTDDAYVAGNRVPVMAEVHGTVVALTTDNTMPVRRGQTVVRLDDTDARVALQQAEAKLGAAVRHVESEYAKEKQLRAEVATRKAALGQAQHDYRRNADLHARGYYPKRELEQSGTSLEVDRHELEAARQALESLHADLGETDLAQHPDVQLAAAQLRAAYLALERTSIVAPVTGFVANRNVQVGQQIDPGTALMAIVPSQEVWVDANFKESQLDRVRIGQPVVMHADAYGRSVAFHGKVIGIGAGTGSAFSLLPPQNATGNWIKVVQRVPVRIGIARADIERHRLQIGLSMNVSVDTRRGAGAERAPDVVDPAGYSTLVYDTRAGDADELIARIIRANLTGRDAGAGGNGPVRLADDSRPRFDEADGHGG